MGTFIMYYVISIKIRVKSFNFCKTYLKSLVKNKTLGTLTSTIQLSGFYCIKSIRNHRFCMIAENIIEKKIYMRFLCFTDNSIKIMQQTAIGSVRARIKGT